MGVPKQLVPLGEGTLLGCALQNLRTSSVYEIVIVLGHAADEIQRRVSLNDLKVIVNADYVEGMASSLRAGLAAVSKQTDAVLVVLADQPFIRPSTIDRIIDGYCRSKPQIAIPYFRGFRGNPVLLDRSVFAEVMNIKGDVGCRAIFGNHVEGILKVPVEDVGILQDADTSEDLERLRDAHQAGLDVLLQFPSIEGQDVERSSVANVPELLIVGREKVALALVKLGRLLHFKVTLVDPVLRISEVPQAHAIIHYLDLSQLLSGGERFIIVASRGQFDEDALEQAVGTEAAYIGLVANRTRGNEIAERLRMKGVHPEKLAKIRAPAGLEIGATEPEEVALSIMAEIVAERSRRIRMGQSCIRE